MTSTISIKTDAELKKQAEALFSDLGMSMATAFNIFLRQSVRENRIPFEITRDTPNAATKEALREVAAMKENPSFGKSYTDVDVMIQELLA